MAKPLPLPENFNPETFMLSKATENGVFHESRQGVRFAAQLVANGTPQDLRLAHKVLDAVLQAQERCSDDPHYGNFMWMIEDSVVQDLNAVEFNLEHLIPMMLQYADRLSPEMQTRAECRGIALYHRHRWHRPTAGYDCFPKKRWTPLLVEEVAVLFTDRYAPVEQMLVPVFLNKGAE